MFWPHTKTAIVFFDEHLRGLSNFDCQLTIGYGEMKIANRSCLSQTPMPELAPLLSATTDKRVQATSINTSDNNSRDHYILFLPKINFTT